MERFWTIKIWSALIPGIVVLGSMYLPGAYAESTEQDYVAAAAIKLEYMSVCAQKGYDAANHEEYPGPAFCHSDLCWNSSSIIGSTQNLVTALSPVCTGFSLSIEVSSGDIRFRCRYQKGDTVCFAYRCEEREPAGCKQKWRLERRRVGAAVEGLMKCVDVENSDYCHNFENPVTPLCPLSCS